MDYMGHYYRNGNDGENLGMYSSHCSRFSRRNDFDIFSMSTYQSCENCRHLSADDRCVANAQSTKLLLK